MINRDVPDSTLSQDSPNSISLWPKTVADPSVEVHSVSGREIVWRSPGFVGLIWRLNGHAQGIVRLTGLEMADRKRSRLSRGELTPFSERGNAVLFEDIAGIKVAV